MRLFFQMTYEEIEEQNKQMIEYDSKLHVSSLLIHNFIIKQITITFTTLHSNYWSSIARRKICTFEQRTL